MEKLNFMNQFDLYAKNWWNKDSTYKILHEINPIRTKFITDNITKNTLNDTNNNQNLNVLDIGCGGGLLSFELAKLGFKTIGIDESKNSILEARKKLYNIKNYFYKHNLNDISACNLNNELDVDENNNLNNVNCSKSNMNDDQYNNINNLNKDFNKNTVNLKLPSFICANFSQYAKYCHFKQKSFNYICALEIIEHIDDPEIFIKDALSILNNGGLLFISTINRNLKSLICAKFIAEYCLNWVPKGMHEFSKFLKPEEINYICKKYNAKIIKANGINLNIYTFIENYTATNYKNIYAKYKKFTEKLYEKNILQKTHINSFPSCLNWQLDNNLSLNYILCIQKI